jgi:hypothetical protein
MSLSLHSASEQVKSSRLSRYPLMVLSDALGCGLQFIIPSENVLPSFLRTRFWRAKVLDKTWGIDDSAQTRRATQDVGPDCCDLIFTRAPATSSEKAFAAGLNYNAMVSM